MIAGLQCCECLEFCLRKKNNDTCYELQDSFVGSSSDYESNLWPLEIDRNLCGTLKIWLEGGSYCMVTLGDHAGSRRVWIFPKLT